jgi:hypothetical protein
VLDARDVASWGTDPSPAHQEYSFWAPVDTAGFDTYANGLFAFTHNPGSSARACAAPFLTDIASHAAARRAHAEEGVINTDDRTRNGQGWLDDADDSDSSFTPSEYRPRRNAYAGKRKDEDYAEVQDKIDCEAQDSASQTDSSFTPSEYKVDNFKFYKTLDGKVELKGKGKAAGEDHMLYGQDFTGEGYKHTREEEWNGRAEHHATQHEQHTQEH